MFSVSKSGEIKLTRGDTARLTVSIADDAGEPYTMQEGDILTMTVKKNITDAEPCIQKTASGSNTFHIKPTDTASLAFGKYKYDVQLTTLDGDVYTVIPPNVFELLQEVTS